MAIISNRFPQVLKSIRANGTAVTAAAATSLLTSSAAAGKTTLPADFFRNVGEYLGIRAHGRFSTVITTPGTFRFDVRFGGTVVFDTLAIALATADAYTNQPWWLEIDLWVDTIGASATLFGNSRLFAANIAGAPATPPKGAFAAITPWNTAPAAGTAFDATASQQVDLFFTQTAATGSCQLHNYRLIAEVEA